MPSQSEQQEFLKNLGFSKPQILHGRSSIIDLLASDERCGIYILYFANGDYYVGQAVNVKRRYTQHRSTFDDISFLSFKSVSQERLDEVEDNTIKTLEMEKFPLRNIRGTSITLGECEFDEIMPQEVQENWLNDLNFIDKDGLRRNVPELSRKSERSFKRFQKESNSELIKEFLHIYIPQAIPAYKRSEIDYWSLTSPNHYTPARINIFWQEVLAIRTDSVDPLVAFQLARSVLDDRPALERLRFRLRNFSAKRINHQYQPGGQDQIRFHVPLAKATEFFKEPAVLSAIRLFNLRMMRKGRCNSNRSHCIQLVNELIDESELENG